MTCDVGSHCGPASSTSNDATCDPRKGAETEGPGRHQAVETNLELFLRCGALSLSSKNFGGQNPKLKRIPTSSEESARKCAGCRPTMAKSRGAGLHPGGRTYLWLVGNGGMGTIISTITTILPFPTNQR